MHMKTLLTVLATTVAFPCSHGFSSFSTSPTGLFGITTKKVVNYESIWDESKNRVMKIRNQRGRTKFIAKMSSSPGEEEEGSFTKVGDSESDVATPFVDPTTGSFIECYIDSVATVEGIEYSIGVPCDYSVALCFFDENGELNPVDLDDKDMMDSVFPVAESIVEEEFGEELALVRTPQTLTLVGELELGEDDDDYEFDLEEMDDEEEEVEILLSFDHDDKEFNLVRLLDPVLLVAKSDKDNQQSRILLSPEESDKVMPYLEEMILDYQEENDSMTP